MADEPTWTRRRFLTSTAGASVLGAAGLALTGCGLASSSSTDRNAGSDDHGWGGELVDPPLPKPDVTFTTADGQPFPFLEATKGKLAMLFFGFTHCPNQCPVYLNTLASARQAIGTGAGSRPQVLFVGVDLARDTPEALKKFVEGNDPTFIGLTGSKQVIDEASKQLQIPAPTIGTPDAKGDYSVGHYSKAVAYTPDGKGHRLYGYDVRQQQFVHDLPRLAKGTYT